VRIVLFQEVERTQQMAPIGAERPLSAESRLSGFGTTSDEAELLASTGRRNTCLR